MEEVHDLIPEKLKIIQNNRYFKFGTDSVLLANYVNVKEGDHVLDLGTGSGVIPLLLSYKQSPECVIGIEIQPELIELAERNVRLNNLDDIINIVEGDLRNLDNYIKPGSLDQVVSNPPFMPVGSGKISENKFKAVARHELKVKLEDIVRAASCALRSGGHFNLVHRAWRMGEVFSLLREYNLEPKKLRIVYPRFGRLADSFLLKARKDGGCGLKIEPALTVYQKDSNEYTHEVKQMYGEDIDE